MRVSDIQNAGLRSEIAVHRLTGIVEDHPDFIICRSVNEPGFYWANAMVLSSPPTQNSFPAHIDRFLTAFQSQPDVRHVAFGWSQDVAAEWAVELGWKLDSPVCMSLSKPRDSSLHRSDVHVRPLSLTAESEWEAVLEIRLSLPAYADETQE